MCVLCMCIPFPLQLLNTWLSEPLTNRGVLLGTLLQDILHPSHHLLNVFLQIANKLGIKKKISCKQAAVRRLGTVIRRTLGHGCSSTVPTTCDHLLQNERERESWHSRKFSLPIWRRADSLFTLGVCSGGVVCAPDRLYIAEDSVRRGSCAVDVNEGSLRLPL
jgi:hypothetical protein